MKHLIEFGDNYSVLLEDVVLRNKLIHHVYSWCESSARAFPGSQPVSIERWQVPQLFSNQYWVCEKTDGMRYLFCCITLDEKHFCFVMNRKQEIYLLQFNVLLDAFHGSVLDGELVKNSEGKYIFYVFDTYASCGVTVRKQSHSLRIEASKKVVNFIQSRTSNPFEVRLKHFRPVEQMWDYVHNFVPFLNHGIDGYVFTPENKELSHGTNYAMFKWKERYCNTIDFFIDETYQAFIYNKNRLELANVTLYREGFDIPHVPCVVECQNIGFKKWKPILIRTDKKYPNNILTFKKTILNIRENIKLCEFFAKH
jgi:mRNA guanylyltransferase